MKPIDIKPADLKIVREILAKYVAEREVRAFGSRVTWSAKQYSDLDLVVMGEEPLTLKTEADLAESFRASDLPFKVDVVDWATTKPKFREIIEKNCTLVKKRGQEI